MAPKKRSPPKKGASAAPKPVAWEGVGDQMEQADLKSWMDKMEKKSAEEQKVKLLEVTADLAKYEPKVAAYEQKGESASDAAVKATRKLRKLQLQRERTDRQRWAHWHWHWHWRRQNRWSRRWHHR